MQGVYKTVVSMQEVYKKAISMQDVVKGCGVGVSTDKKGCEYARIIYTIVYKNYTRRGL